MVECGKWNVNQPLTEKTNRPTTLAAINLIPQMQPQEVSLLVVEKV